MDKKVNIGIWSSKRWPLDKPFIFRRVDEIARSNVPHIKIIHSPTGLEWGYGGSGPADMAYNILFLTEVKDEDITRLYQKFKWEIIATIPKEGGILYPLDVIEWISKNRVT